MGKPYFEVGNKWVDFKQEVGFGGRIVLNVETVVFSLVTDKTPAD